MDDKTLKAKRDLMKVSTALLGVLTLVSIALFFLAVQWVRISSDANYDRETITVTGYAEEFVSPDIAETSFTITEEAKTVSEAQEMANKKLENITGKLDDLGIEEKDIKATGFNINPKYDTYYALNGIRCLTDYCRPPYQWTQEIIGYEATWYVNVTVRDIDIAGDVINAIGGSEVRYAGGLNFRVDDQKELEKDLRDKALEDAHDEAKRIAKGLGVRLGDVVSFNEYGGGVYYSKNTRMVYDATEESYGLGGADVAMIAPSSAPGVSIPTGENKLTSEVTVVYEIR